MVSYISEVPVWKSTYRIVVPTQGKPLLQGWAVVDNTVGEDWKNVQLSLVAGAPQSFVQELSQPYYTRRPVVALPSNAMVTPQTHEATMGSNQIVESTDFNGALPRPQAAPTDLFQANAGATGPLISGSAGRVGAGAGGGVGGGSFKVQGGASSEALERATAVAQSADLGDLFEYRLKDHITIRKNQSALVPILQARLDAEKVSVWGPTENRALSALWVENTSGLTLDGGSFNVLEGEAFAGEGLMDLIKPGEKRVLSYATDLGLLVEAKEKDDQQRVTRVVIMHGAMIQSTEERQERTYTIRNRDASPRTVIVEHPARAGWKLSDGEQPAESTVSYHRFRMTVEPKKTATFSSTLGVCESYAADIRAGRHRPHPRHWEALAKLAGLSTPD